MREVVRCNVAYVGLTNLDNAYDRVFRKALWQLLRMCGIDGKGLFLFSVEEWR